MNQKLPSEKVIFPEPASVGERDWGEEILLAVLPSTLTLKKLVLKAGKKGGLQYHRLKNECGILLEGQMIVRHLDDDRNLVERTLGPGDVFHFPPGAIHQEEAVTDCVMIEASSPHFNDRVRVEEFFGITDWSGLPTTEPDEIETR